MKILSARHLPDNRLDEETIGDTHTALTGSLAQVDRSMAALGLRGATWADENGKGTGFEGWRTVVIVFARNEQELQTNAQSNITAKFGRVWYERRVGTISLKQEDAYQNFKTLSFELAGVKAEPQVNEIYKLASINNKDGLANSAINNGYTVMTFTKLVANRQKA